MSRQRGGAVVAFGAIDLAATAGCHDQEANRIGSSLVSAGSVELALLTMT
jgi:hypothetical protein